MKQLEQLTCTKPRKISWIKVFRAKMLTGLAKNNLACPPAIPEKWVVDCQNVGSGDKARIYLGHYLYRRVIREKDILSCKVLREAVTNNIPTSLVFLSLLGSSQSAHRMTMLLLRRAKER